MKKAKLDLDLLEQEMELLGGDETTGFVGGVRPESMANGASGGGGGSGVTVFSEFGLTRIKSHYANTETSTSAFGSWAASLPEGTYTNQGNGSFSYSQNITSDEGYMLDKNVYTSAYGYQYNRVSFDNGASWQQLMIQSVDVHEFSLDKYSQAFQNTGYILDGSALVAYGLNNPQAVNMFGKLSYVAQAGGFALDVNALAKHYNENKGNMDGIRFGIKTGGTGLSIIAGSAYGGPQGIVIGTLIGVATMGTEFAYDQALKTMNEIWGQFTNNYGNGGLPQM